jgi:hypothetical protein
MKGQRKNKVKPMTVSPEERSHQRQPRYSKEEFSRRGHELYESRVRDQVEEGNHGKIVAIDIDTGAFEVADDSLTAAKQLLMRYPDAQIFGIRIGHRAVHRFGCRSTLVSA